MDTRSARFMFTVAVLLRCPSVGAQAMPEVSLISNVDTIKTNLTETLMLKLTFDGASVPDTVFQSIVSIVIKREDTDEEVATLTPVGSVTYVIEREDNDEEVATLTPVAKVFNAFKDGSAKGEITGKKGFLEVMARYPNSNHCGNFVAVVKTLNIEGDTKDYTASKTVSHANATIADIIKEINDLKAKESTKVWFSAGRDNGQSHFWEGVRTNTDIFFNKALVNQGNGFNTNTGVFECPVAGSYYIRYDLHVFPMGDGETRAGVSLLRNGASVIWSYMSDGDTASSAIGVMGNGRVLQLNKGDKLKLRTVTHSRFYWRYDGIYTSTFSGYLLK